VQFPVENLSCLFIRTFRLYKELEFDGLSPMQINVAMVKCGFLDKGRLHMECLHKDGKRIVYIKPGFIKVQKVPQNKFVYPDQAKMQKIKELIQDYDVTLLPLIMVYKNYNGSGRISRLRNHEGHCGLLCITGSKCVYYDACLVEGTVLARNPFHGVVTRKLPRCLELLGLKDSKLQRHFFKRNGP